MFTASSTHSCRTSFWWLFSVYIELNFVCHANMLPNLSSNFTTSSTRRESGEFVVPYLELAWDTKVSRKVPNPSGFLRVAKENKMPILVP